VTKACPRVYPNAALPDYGRMYSGGIWKPSLPGAAAAAHTVLVDAYADAHASAYANARAAANDYAPVFIWRSAKQIYDALVYAKVGARADDTASAIAIASAYAAALAHAVADAHANARTFVNVNAPIFIWRFACSSLCRSVNLATSSNHFGPRCIGSSKSRNRAA